MTTLDQIISLLPPTYTQPERAVHVLLIALLSHAPDVVRLKEPGHTRTCDGLVIATATSVIGSLPLGWRLTLRRSIFADDGCLDTFDLLVFYMGEHIHVSRMMAAREAEEFVGLRWAGVPPEQVMLACPTLLLIVRRLPELFTKLLGAVAEKHKEDPVTYRTGDVIRHIPSGEEWLVATADARHVSPCGWPYGLARLDEVELVEAATDEAHLKLLQELANMSVPDPRRSYAQDVLAKMAGTPPA